MLQGDCAPKRNEENVSYQNNWEFQPHLSKKPPE
jgi:hypothetical protein